MNVSKLTFCSRVVTSCSDFTSLNLRSLICLLASPENRKLNFNQKKRKRKNKKKKKKKFLVGIYSEGPEDENPSRSLDCPPLDSGLRQSRSSASDPVETLTVSPAHKERLEEDSF